MDQRKLSRVANTTESTISRFLHGHGEMRFESVLRIVKYLYPNDQVNIMGEYILTQRSRNARHGLEYCSNNQLWAEFDYLIELLSNSSNPADREWARMYSLIKMRKDAKLPSIKLLSEVEEFKPREVEMRVLKSILKGLIYFDLGENKSILLHNQDTHEQIEEIRSDYIQASYSVRLGLLSFAVHLFSYNLEKARQSCYSIIGQDFIEHVKAAAYINLSQTYLFSNYQLALEYSKRSIDVAITFSHSNYLKMANLNHSFLNSFYGIDFEFTQPLDDHQTLANYIFYLINKGDISLAQGYLEEIDINSLTDWDKGFYFYYKGLIDEDVSTFYKSVDSFVSADNYFFIHLPLLKLQKLGESEEALKILSKRGLIYEENSNSHVDF
ncbi:AimR family lysis-lysogeny pheromone receptor [Bacillus horti]|nr:AimR family lysis-lysogeny pheromone receptor [Bacillus horti]